MNYPSHALTCYTSNGYYKLEDKPMNCYSEEDNIQGYFLDKTGSEWIWKKCYDSCETCTQINNFSDGYGEGNNATYTRGVITFNASSSNTIYQDNTHVHPNSISTMLLIKYA